MYNSTSRLRERRKQNTFLDAGDCFGGRETSLWLKRMYPDEWNDQLVPEGKGYCCGRHGSYGTGHRLPRRHL